MEGILSVSPAEGNDDKDGEETDDQGRDHKVHAEANLGVGVVIAADYRMRDELKHNEKDHKESSTIGLRFAFRSTGSASALSALLIASSSRAQVAKTSRSHQDGYGRVKMRNAPNQIALLVEEGAADEVIVTHIPVMEHDQD